MILVYIDTETVLYYVFTSLYRRCGSVLYYVFTLCTHETSTRVQRVIRDMKYKH